MNFIMLKVYSNYKIF